MAQEEEVRDGGRQPANTQPSTTSDVRAPCRGGNMKFRAFRLTTVNFSWGADVCTRKVQVS
jgi:ribosomal protein S8E